MSVTESKNGPTIRTLVLDAAPLITQAASALQQFAQNFYTTPGVYAELKDEHARQQLVFWADKLQVRHPKPEYIQKVSSFAKLTGDYAVLSLNDIHIIALAYELEVELNKGDWRLRKYPGEKISFINPNAPKKEEIKEKVKEEATEESTPEIEEDVNKVVQEDQTKTKKPRRRGGKRQREKREAELQKLLDQEDQEEEVEVKEETRESEKAEVEIPTSEIKDESSRELTEESDLSEDYNEDDDDGEWITNENLYEEMLKDNNEQISESDAKKKTGPYIKLALATGDFACQNVAMQVGLNLMNPLSGKQIKRVRNYMYRCHACFRLTPIPKNGKPKHFCPKCGGNTLLRCAVSVDNITGKITPHLKANFQWFKRGEKFSIPSPLSKNQQKRQGNGGFQHNKESRHKSLQDPLILREDQKEYAQAVKNDDWQRRQQEKMLQEWVGGGSADNYMSPFTSSNTTRPSGVKVGKGRFVNSSKGKRK
ncbi:Nin one binding Zn-ribbon like-domain-containing protein [Scheffersomyces amazonensis]|uniref:Nin one binding Zn-ribbon like-domain-containing protein n=1 Tax=Scheffersomyces amazonensis TaxID=1078765 RepID=UPI00315D3CA6